MTYQQNLPNLNEVMQWEPSQVLAWLKEVEISFDPTSSLHPNNYPWLALAEGAAQRGHFPKPDLHWAQVAVTVYECLAAQAQSPSYERKYLEPLMLLRANLIRHFGSKPNDPVLDINILVNWCIENLNIFYAQPGSSINIDYGLQSANKGLSYSQGVEMVASWKRKYGVENIFKAHDVERNDLLLLEKFRNIYSTLYPLELASESGLWKPEGETAAWLVLRETLIRGEVT